MKNSLFIILVAGFSLPPGFLKAQVSGDYRSIQTGNWNAVNTWQQFNGTAWVNAVTPPSEANGKISIRTNDTVYTNTVLMADEIVIDPGGTLHLIVTSGESRFILHNGAGTDMICNGSLVIDNNCLLDNDTTTGGSTIDYKFESLTQNGGLEPDITFSGIVAQKITGSGYIGRMILNNSNNLEITGTTSFQSIDFMNGKINVTGTGILVTTQYSGAFTGQNTSRFIDGKVSCIIYENTPVSFLLPLGKGDKYLPMVFNVAQNTSVQTNFYITITGGPPPSRTLPPTLNKVSFVRFFTISREPSASNITNASLQLTYLADDEVTDPTNLRIAKSAGTQWENLGGMGTGTPSGTITSTNNFTTFSDFVLANATGGGNVLPLHITLFNAFVKQNSVVLFWKAESEPGISHYEIERSNTGSDWKTIGSVKANSQGAYTYTDIVLETSLDYQYRLKEVNKDNSGNYSKTVSVKISRPGKMYLYNVYPNPVKEFLSYTVASGSQDILSINISDMRGSLLVQKMGIANQSAMIPVGKLSNGNYVLTVYNKTTGEKVTQNFLKE